VCVCVCVCVILAIGYHSGILQQLAEVRH
jgi:hypothetical protein